MRVVLFFIGIIWKSTVCGQAISCMLTTPQKNKTVYYLLDNLPEVLDLGHEGPDNVWNFAGLKAPVVHSFQYLPREEGTYYNLFDDADILLKDPWGLEKYYKLSGSNASLLAEVIPSASRYDAPIIKRYDKPVSIWNSKNNLGAHTISDGMWHIDLDEWQLEKLGINGYEQLRIEVQEQISEDIDAKGILYLPKSVHDVLRITRNRTSEIKVFQQVNDQWIRTDNQIVSKLNIDIPVTSTEYVFINGPDKEVLAQVMMEGSSVSSVLFKSEEHEKHRLYDPSRSNEFVLYPNTSFGHIRLDFIDFNPGEYSLEISNIIGRMIWSSKYSIEHDHTLKEDLSFLPKGTYLYSLYDEQRIKLFTRRMAIIKP